MLHVIGMVLSWIGAVGIIGIGIAYLMKHEGNASGFGLPTLPSPDARGWWQVKGIRDIGTGLTLIVFALFAPAQLPLALLPMAVIPFGDACIILANKGSRKTAYSVHVSTAVAMLIAAGLLVL